MSAACTLDEVDGAPRIELTVDAQAPGIGTAETRRMVDDAAELCPVSNALRGNVEITVRNLTMV